MKLTIKVGLQNSTRKKKYLIGKKEIEELQNWCNDPSPQSPFRYNVNNSIKRHEHMRSNRQKKKITKRASTSCLIS